jgi:hypothetical protein
MTEKKASLSSQAWSLYAHQAKKVFPTAFNFTMILIAVLALGVWVNESVYLTVPLIVLPFFFAYQMATDYLQKGSAITNRQFFAYYGGYFSMPFTGCYRVIRNFLFALLYSIGGAFLIGIAYYAIANAVSPSFQSSIQALSDLLQNSNVNDINAYLESAPDLVYFYTTIGLSENAIFFYVFFHFIASYGLNPYLRSVISGASPRVCNAIYVGGIRLVRGAFWKDYYGALWLGTILLFVGYGAGVGVGFLFSGSASFLGICGFAGAALLLSFYLPYYFNVVSLLADKYHATFADYSIQMAEMTLKELEKSRKLTDEEAAGLQRSIASAKKERDRKAGDPDDKEDEDDEDEGDDDSSDDEH